MNDTPIAEVSAASQAEGGHHRQGEHRPEHEQVAVREVDQLDDAVHQCVAERDQGNDRAVRDPDQQHLQDYFVPLHRGLAVGSWSFEVNADSNSAAPSVPPGNGRANLHVREEASPSSMSYSYALE